jgi:malate dehydrogenase (quinone)
MVEILEKCFAGRMEDWTPKLKEILPSYGQSLAADESLYRSARDHADGVLGL